MFYLIPEPNPNLFLGRELPLQFLSNPTLLVVAIGARYKYLT